MWLLQITFCSLLITTLTIKLVKFILAAKFLSSFPRAKYTQEALGKKPSRLMWLKRLVFGHLIDFGQGSGSNASAFKWRTKQIRQCGAHVIRFFYKSILVVYDPATITYLSNLDQNLLAKSGTFKRIFDYSMRDGILFQEGDKWKQMRRLFEPFSHTARLRLYHEHFKQLTGKMLSKWEAKSGGESFTVDQDLQSLTLNTFMRSILGIDFDLSESDSGLADAFIAISKDMSMPKSFGDLIKAIPFVKPFTQAGRELKQAQILRKQFIEQILDSEVKQDDQDCFKPKTLVHYLSESGMSRDRIAANVFTFLLAGHETNKSTLNWALFELGRRVDLQERLYTEIKEKRATGSSYADVFSVSNHETDSLLASFIMEVQRFYCVAPEIVPRKLKQTVTLPSGQAIPAGTTFMFGIWETHHNPYIWTEPALFDAGRFLTTNLQPNQFVPFSAGQRKCVGYKYAIVQLRTVLTLLIEKYRIELDREHKTEMTRIMTMNPTNGIKIRIVKRQ